MKKVVLSVAGAFLVFTVIPRIAGAAPLPSPMQQESKQKTKTFSGTVIKNGDNFVLSDGASKLSYVLDDAQKASPYEGKRVKVTGNRGCRQQHHPR